MAHFHAAIRSVLDMFAAEAAELRGAGRVGAADALVSLSERHRFLRAFCSAHSASEDALVLPAARCSQPLVIVLGSGALPLCCCLLQGPALPYPPH